MELNESSLRGHPVPERLDAALAAIFQAEGLQPADAGAFHSAIARDGAISCLAFVVIDLREGEARESDLAAAVHQARLWCRDELLATFVVREAGLNLILLHSGQLSAQAIRKLPDATGLHSSILQSVSSIDCRDMSVTQAKTWIVIGRVRRLLKRLTKLDLAP